ncbi:type IV pilus assembly protein PilX [Aquipseudomonas alcaligenes]|uniref:pilus assembly PilX family protein n=1 Tax=Aquipseudomonas alcaligenes TaxID=43263 RepID=UPI00095449D0|nr:PilX N-terminal domain-containing pilus assembly protein [Pseudomonas alcaligenes]SIS04960.1 type IV pilus assembly protein PilX [Pseudomonas alcaligenes]
MNVIRYQSQRGMALFVSLIFLLLLTIIGVVGMQNATLQEKMAGNSKFKNESLQYAESGLRVGEDVIADALAEGNSLVCDACVGSQCNVPVWGQASASAGVCYVWRSAPNSLFYIQNLGQSTAAINVESGSSATLYRVTAVASVGNATTALESIYAVQSQ